MESFFWGLVGGFIAWLCTAIVGQPLYNFLSLRTEAARVVSLYERSIPFDGSLGSLYQIPQDTWHSERKRAYQMCGSQFMALAAANGTLTTILQRWKIYPKSAGGALLAMADANPGSPAAHQLQQSLISALKLKLT